MTGRVLGGVDKSSNSVCLITNTRRDKKAKMMSQLRSNPRSAQPTITCEAENAEVETFMDTSLSIISFQ
jgi:hypothetical protein